ncbi:MAG TPA: RNA polymerase sporulation sigma factor SigH [Acidimicrobiales bacterium]|jgi:RNA polymerase sporulation-specific sigma factor|nr:RNA polymerase sporulation sigma factor SigH [Acidimicrobiales bacterium]
MAVCHLVTTLSELGDEELVARSQDGDRDALAVLLQRYRRFARVKSRTYFLVGADADDIEQEGLIGLYKAARDFRPDRQSSFRAFAELCVTRQVISAIKAATRHKHRPLNQYVSISGVRGGEDPAEYSVEALLDDHRIADPADEVISREGLDRMHQSMADALSGLEVDVLELYVDGRSYQEIGDHLGRHVKSIDNALQRIKRKLDHHLAEPMADRESSLVA